MGGAGEPVILRVKLPHGTRPQKFVVTDPEVAVSLFPGDHLIVETETGMAIGEVLPDINGLGVRGLAAVPAAHKVLRRATRDDVAMRGRQVQREQDAHRICLMKIRERGLPMKLARVEQLFDGSRLIFYFTAEGRVDFRELVRELASEFRTRIELRQVGVRDEAKMLGGYGACGRPLCCSSWLASFEPISIKMATRQELTLNPSKLSGLCGRLKCCLRFELPEPGAPPATHEGSADETLACPGRACEGCAGCEQ